MSSNLSPSCLELIMESYPELESKLEYDEVVRDFKNPYKTAVVGVIDNFTEEPMLIYSETLLKAHTSIDNLPGLILSSENKTREYFDMLADSVTPDSTFAKLLFADGFDEAIVGILFEARPNSPMVVAYSESKCIDILMKGFSEEINPLGDDEDDAYLVAYEYYQYNVVGSYVGPYTPVFISEFQS